MLVAEPAERRPAALENRPQARARAELFFHRFEPSLDSAVQRVVVEALVVRLVRLARDGALRWRGERRVTPAPVPPAVGHVGVELEAIPAVGECVPVGERAEGLEDGAHCGAFDERKTARVDRGMQALER
jgi:hypothetical protein